jgi:hypothetical protein
MSFGRKRKLSLVREVPEEIKYKIVQDDKSRARCFLLIEGKWVSYVSTQIFADLKLILDDYPKTSISLPDKVDEQIATFTKQIFLWQSMTPAERSQAIGEKENGKVLRSGEAISEGFSQTL